jgi:hypothetical protein
VLYNNYNFWVQKELKRERERERVEGMGMGVVLCVRSSSSLTQQNLQLLGDIYPTQLKAKKQNSCQKTLEKHLKNT